PSAKTAAGRDANVEFLVKLNHGDAYLVQGDESDTLNDLTGSFVRATKPIAFFSGHQRTQIGENLDQGFSRDHLCEQLAPISMWHDSAFVVPFRNDFTLDSVAPDVARILSASDNND